MAPSYRQLFSHDKRLITFRIGYSVSIDFKVLIPRISRVSDPHSLVSFRQNIRQRVVKPRCFCIMLCRDYNYVVVRSRMCSLCFENTYLCSLQSSRKQRTCNRERSVLGTCWRRKWAGDASVRSCRTACSCYAYEFHWPLHFLIRMVCGTVACEQEWYNLTASKCTESRYAKLSIRHYPKYRLTGISYNKL
jgi:hypothetical protein